MNTPRKHAELIKAWADGAEIEVNCPKNGWGYVSYPYWCDDREESDYRIKPKPDVVLYVCAETEGVGPMTERKTCLDNLKLTFDGETGKLKAAEVLQ